MSPTVAVYTVTAPPNPGLTPPPGVIPDFQDPYTLQPYLELECALFIVVTTAVVAARMFVKVRIVKKILWEDWTATLGWLTFMLFLAIQWRTGLRGAGIHQWNISFEQVQYNLRLSNIGDMFYCISILCIKLSILLLILRIFLSVQRDIFYWVTHILIFCNTAFYAISFFMAIFNCTPRSKIWNPGDPGHCFDNKTLYIFSAGFNVASDIAMLSVPLYLIWTLQTSVRRKIGISAIFGTGLFACISSVMRLIYQVKLNRTLDYSFVKTQTALWGYSESACGILCGSLPILPLLWHYFSQRPSSGVISLAPRHSPSSKNPNHYSPSRDARNWDDAYETRHEANGDWSKAEDGHIAPLPQSHIEREESDEQAINNAIVGLHPDGSKVGKTNPLSKMVHEHMAGKAALR